MVLARLLRLHRVLARLVRQHEVLARHLRQRKVLARLLRLPKVLARLLRGHRVLARLPRQVLVPVAPVTPETRDLAPVSRDWVVSHETCYFLLMYLTGDNTRLIILSCRPFKLTSNSVYKQS